MKGLIEFSDKKNAQFYDDYMLYYDPIYDYSVKILIDSKTSLEDILKDNKKFYENLPISLSTGFTDVDEDLIRIVNDYDEHEFDLIREAEYVSFDFDYNFINQYIIDLFNIFIKKKYFLL